MKILALEFSPAERSIAAVIGGEVRGFALDADTRGTRAFDCIRHALQQAGISAPEIECIAVGLGPGSYAGTRIAIAIAQGWELARGVKLIGLSSADGIARRINTPEGLVRFHRNIPFTGIANVVFDAQRNEAYVIRYQIGEGAAHPLGGFELLMANEEQQRRERGEIFLKADLGPWKLGKEMVLFSDARVIGQMAAQRNDFVSGERLEPIYLRKAEFVKTRPTGSF